MSIPVGNDYDWSDAFQVACRDGISIVAGSACEKDPFTPEDIAETLYASEGENDEADWLWVGRLVDGRWAFVSAWCDYTGWG